MRNISQIISNFYRKCEHLIGSANYGFIVMESEILVPSGYNMDVDKLNDILHMD